MLDDRFKFEQYVADELYELRRDQRDGSNQVATTLMNLNRSVTRFYKNFETANSRMAFFLAMVAALQIVTLILLLTR